MKNIYKFLFYKLYRFAISNEKSVSINWSFISLATIFEILHLALLADPLKYYKIELNLSTKFTPVIFLVLGSLCNYLYFIRNKRIQKINIHFQHQKRIIWKDNLLFFAYIIFLFTIMFVQVFILKKIRQA
jgi:hypothetical protein